MIKSKKESVLLNNYIFWDEIADDLWFHAPDEDASKDR